MKNECVDARNSRVGGASVATSSVDLGDAILYLLMLHLVFMILFSSILASQHNVNVTTATKKYRESNLKLNLLVVFYCVSDLLFLHVNLDPVKKSLSSICTSCLAALPWREKNESYFHLNSSHKTLTSRATQS